MCLPRPWREYDCSLILGLAGWSVQTGLSEPGTGGRKCGISSEKQRCLSMVPQSHPGGSWAPCHLLGSKVLSWGTLGVCEVHPRVCEGKTFPDCSPPPPTVLCPPQVHIRSWVGGQERPLREGAGPFHSDQSGNACQLRRLFSWMNGHNNQVPRSPSYPHS